MSERNITDYLIIQDLDTALKPTMVRIISLLEVRLRAILFQDLDETKIL